MEKRCFNQQEAREYLGVKRKFFDTHIAPRLQGVKAGTSLIYEKADIDKAWEAYKLESGSGGPEVKQWDAQQVSSRPRMVATKLTRSTGDSEFSNTASAVLKKRRAGLSVC